MFTKVTVKNVGDVMKLAGRHSVTITLLVALAVPGMAACGASEPAPQQPTGAVAPAPTPAAVDFPPSKFGNFERISDEKAWYIWQYATVNNPGVTERPRSAQDFVENKKQHQLRSFASDFGLSPSNIKSTAIYEFVDLAKAPTKIQPPSATGLLHVVVFTLNEDYSVDKASALSAAKAATNVGRGPKLVGDSAFRSNELYFGVGKHWLISARFDTMDDDLGEAVLQTLGEQIESSGALK